MSVILEEQGLLTSIDHAAFEAYCVIYGRWSEAEREIKKHGTIVKSPNKSTWIYSPWLNLANRALKQMKDFLVEFGMSPSSRSRVSAADNKEEQDPFAGYDGKLKVMKGGRK